MQTKTNECRKQCRLTQLDDDLEIFSYYCEKCQKQVPEPPADHPFWQAEAEPLDRTTLLIERGLVVAAAVIAAGLLFILIRNMP